ncbi:MAG: DMT family transporter [Bacillota bacterium]|nr:DMT family transporter [Bacillota bacterium]
MNQLKKTYFLLILVPLFWGGAFTAGRLAVGEVPPFTVAFLRFSLAALLLIPVMLIWDPKGYKPQLKQLPALFLLGLTGVFSYNALFFSGLVHTTAISGSLIIAANPMATSVLSFFILKEKFTPLQIIGIIVSFTGVTYVITEGSLTTLQSLSFNIGDIMMVGAMLSWAVYSIVGKKVMEGLSAVTSTTYAIIIGALLFMPFYLLEARDFSLGQISINTWISIVYMALFASVLGFVWWYQAIKQIGASKAAVFVNLIPIFSIIIASFFGETVSLNQLLGAALVITGVYLTAKPAKSIVAQPATGQDKLKIPHNE